MSESETTEDTKTEHNPRKRVRHRKKKLYEDILKQMEFYFSDANLTKDRFLGELVKNDPYVLIEDFLKFNKIRSMTTDVSIIAKAMKNSTFLELSEDKLKVKRKSPILPYDADVRTVYVESIPVTASREWLEKVFSEFGRVAYISLPKFKNSHKIKGYAFIEFGAPEEAKKCISTFTKMGCKLPTCMPPEELSSIKMFSVQEPIEDSPVKKEDLEPHEHEPPKKKVKKHRDKKAVKNLELKLSHESDSDRKIDTPSEDNKSILSTPTDENKISDIGLKEEMTSHDEGKSDDDMKRKKKPRKKISKDKGKVKNGLNKDEAPPGALWGLQVLAKSDWKSLRNKYLNLQRKYMKEIKKNLQNKRHGYSSIPAPAEPSLDVEPAIRSTEAEGNKNTEPLEKIPGVFVKDVLPEPCLDVRLTKRTIRSNIHVQHVDVKEGQSEVIVRFDSAKAAEEYCSNSGKAVVLRGCEEEQQWSRAEGARTIRRQRGRDKLLAKSHAPAHIAPASPQPTHTHIRFDD